MEKLTIRDIARMAGVSTTAVSFVLNGRAGVSEATRQRVQAIINETGFTPNIHTRRLNLKRSFTVHVVLRQYDFSLFNLFAMDVLTGIFRESKSLGYSVIFTSVENEAECSELMDAVFGAAPKQSGQIFLHGKEIRTKSPYQAIRNGLAMVTENRRETGFFHNFDIKQNISLLPFVKTARGGGTLGLIDRRFEKRCAEQQRKALRIKCASVNQPVTELSGGNQQKVILGRWLAAQSEILIFDEPTKGIDVGSKAEIYALMRELADSGKGVLVVSSELPELLAVCDTIAVYCEGEIVRVFPHSAATEENIVLAATAGDTE